MAALATGSWLAAAPALAQTAPVPDAIVEDAAPVPPAHATPTFGLPPRDARGGWTTPNRDLDDGETVWHLRVALNVAALGCRDVAGDRLAARYNALLADRAVDLADAGARTEALYQVRYGAAWRAHHDGDMTKLYNFFAQPPAQERFCSEARAVLHQATVVEPSTFVPWATAALQRLEVPFTSFYEAFDAYRIALARYTARRAAAPALAAVASAPAVPTVTVLAVVTSPATALVGPATAPVPVAASEEAGHLPAAVTLALATTQPRTIGPQP